MGSPDRTRGYGVKLVRGPFLRLAPHAQSCETGADLKKLVKQLRADNRGAPIAADLFSGAGGLSLGLEKAGVHVIAAVDHDAEAVETHRHHFPGMTTDWDLADPAVIELLAATLRDLKLDLLVGGPPCQPFSKAGRSMIRYRVRNGLRAPHDERRDLWRSFLDIVRIAQPKAVLMENVPDMALDREMFILRTMVDELETLGYAVEERVVETWRYGVPQFRQRLILVAMAGGRKFSWPEETQQPVTVWNAIGDLPEVEGGWRPAGGADGWAAYEGPKSTFQRAMRAAVPKQDRKRVFDHITRPVREDDAKAFEMMDSSTRYSDLPDEFKRYRDDIFDDKYKRLDEDDLSRTITAHIAKDGYWYIHPRQSRTITVREAARLQTFPDDYRFAGPPSAAFRQIGNAVPPLLAQQLTGSLLECLGRNEPSTANSQDSARLLADWFTTRAAGVRALPWLQADTRWQVIAAEFLLDRSTADQVRFVWPLLNQWRSPDDAIKNDETLTEIGGWIGRESKTVQLLQLADFLADHPDALEQEDLINNRPPGLPESVADIAILAVPIADDDTAEEPVLVTKGILRVAARYGGTAVDRKNRLTDGRLAVARLIGGGKDARDAHLGLVELAGSICRPADPLCGDCPLQRGCVSSRADQLSSTQLF
jgi:DNA (cytosine-5)-methyltransferase 1